MSRFSPLRPACLWLLFSAPLVAQYCDPRSGSPMQMQVQLAFSSEEADAAPAGIASTGEMAHGETTNTARGRAFTEAFEIRVQLQEPQGGTLQESSPNSEGLVRFTVCRKSIYSLRVSGPKIEEVNLNDLQPSRGDKLVNVVLRRKLSKAERKAKEATVAAHRLNVPRKAQRQLDKGNKAFAAGKLTEAEKHFRNALELYSQFDEAANNLGIVLMGMGKREAARASFQRAVEINPRYAAALLNLAKLAVDERRFADSYSLAKRALASEPLNPTALFLAAESAFFERRFDETIAYTRSLHTLPHAKYGLAHFFAARSLESQNQPAFAMSEYQAFLEEDPTDPNADRARSSVALLRVVLAGSSHSK